MGVSGHLAEVTLSHGENVECSGGFGGGMLDLLCVFVLIRNACTILWTTVFALSYFTKHLH